MAGWKLENGKWIKKSDGITELSMVFTSLPFDKHSDTSQRMKFRAVASDTGKDLYDEQMTNELYRSFRDKINNKVPIPEQYKSLVESDYWKGGMPYLSVSHYPDLNGEGVPGIPDEIYIDGNQFKGKGHFFDTAIGRACYNAILKDKNENNPNPIRLSIAFLDLAHRHGDGPVWTRKSLAGGCPECEAGVGNKKYTDGYLVHWALTRVPVNQRAEIEVEKSMGDKITREEDAASIIDPELAKELEKKASMIGRSEALVEMSKNKTVGGESYPSSDFLVVEDSDKPSTWHLQVKKHGKPDHGLMGAAMAALTSNHRGHAYSGPNKGGALAKLKHLYSSENMDYEKAKSEVEKSMANEAEVNSVTTEPIEQVSGTNLSPDPKLTQVPVTEKSGMESVPPSISDDDLSYLPYGGAVALEKAPHVWERGAAGPALESTFALLNDLMKNIYARPDLPDKMKSMADLMTELKGIVQLKPVGGVGEQLQSLADKVLEAKSMAGTEEEKLKSIQPALEALAEAIRTEVRPEDAPVSAPDMATIVKAAVEAAINPLRDEITVLKAEVAANKERPVLPMRQTVVIPKPRSLTPSLLQRAEAEAQVTKADVSKTAYGKDVPAKKSGVPGTKPLKDIVRRSVGL